MLLIFASRFSRLPFLQRMDMLAGNSATGDSSTLVEDDDLDMCLYYLRTLANVFRWAPDSFWKVLASTSVTTENLFGISRISAFNPYPPITTY
jgi:hypothetical protein